MCCTGDATVRQTKITYQVCELWLHARVLSRLFTRVRALVQCVGTLAANLGHGLAVDRLVVVHKLNVLLKHVLLDHLLHARVVERSIQLGSAVTLLGGEVLLHLVLDRVEDLSDLAMG